MIGESVAQAGTVVNAEAVPALALDFDALAVLADPGCRFCHGSGYVEEVAVVERLGELLLWPTGRAFECRCVRGGPCTAS